MRGAAPWLGLALLCASAPAAAAELIVRPRVPAAVIVVSPGGGGGTSHSDLRRAAERALAGATRLTVPSLEQLGVDPLRLDACRRSPTRLTCWSRALRAGAGARAPRFAIIVSSFAVGDGQEQIALLFLDAADAVQRADAAPAGDSEALAAVEDAVFAGVTRVPPMRIPTGDADGLGAVFVRALHALQDRLHAEGLWGALGSVWVQGVLPTTEIGLDGAALGRAGGDEARLLGVPAGTHAVRAGVPWLDGGWEATVEVGADARVLLTVPGPPPAPSGVRLGARWGGLVVAAAGVALVGYGASRGRGVRAACLRRPSDVGECDGLGAPTFAFDPARAPTSDVGAVDRGGVAIAPLGAGLVVAGGVSSAWAWAVGSPEEAPWWGILVGAAAGAATYGLGHALGR